MDSKLKANRARHNASRQDATETRTAVERIWAFAAQAIRERPKIADGASLGEPQPEADQVRNLVEEQLEVCCARDSGAVRSADGNGRVCPVLHAD